METAVWEDHLDEPLESFLVRLGQGLEPVEAMGHVVAAVRETLEEVRVFLANSTRDDAQIRISSQSRIFGKQPGGWFRDLVMQLGATLRVSALAPWAHWITPEVRYQILLGPPPRGAKLRSGPPGDYPRFVDRAQ